jgi:hypothetical protein
MTFNSARNRTGTKISRVRILSINFPPRVPQLVSSPSSDSLPALLGDSTDNEEYAYDEGDDDGGYTSTANQRSAMADWHGGVQRLAQRMDGWQATGAKPKPATTTGGGGAEEAARGFNEWARGLGAGEETPCEPCRPAKPRPETRKAEGGEFKKELYTSLNGMFELKGKDNISLQDFLKDAKERSGGAKEQEEESVAAIGSLAAAWQDVRIAAGINAVLESNLRAKHTDHDKKLKKVNVLQEKNAQAKEQHKANGKQLVARQRMIDAQQAKLEADGDALQASKVKQDASFARRVEAQAKQADEEAEPSQVAEAIAMLHKAKLEDMEAVDAQVRTMVAGIYEARDRNFGLMIMALQRGTGGGAVNQALRELRVKEMQETNELRARELDAHEELLNERDRQQHDQAALERPRGAH